MKRRRGGGSSAGGHCYDGEGEGEEEAGEVVIVAGRRRRGRPRDGSSRNRHHPPTTCCNPKVKLLLGFPRPSFASIYMTVLSVLTALSGGRAAAATTVSAHHRWAAAAFVSSARSEASASRVHSGLATEARRRGGAGWHQQHHGRRRRKCGASATAAAAGANLRGRQRGFVSSIGGNSGDGGVGEEGRIGLERARSASVDRSTQEARQEQQPVELPDWRSDPTLTDVFHLPTLSVPAKCVHTVLGGILKPYVATHMAELDGVHPRVKVVRDFGEEQDEHCAGEKRKALLLDPNQVLGRSHEDGSDAAASAASIGNVDASDDSDGEESASDQAQHLTEMTEQQQACYADLLQAYPSLPTTTLQTLASLNVHPGPPYTLTVPYMQQTPIRILRKLLPPEAQPPPVGYEQVGHVLHLNLKPHHEPYGKLIGDVMLEKCQPTVRSVVSKLGEVTGPYRTYEMNVLAGTDDTNVTLIEHGATLKFDLARVYWSTRLSGERDRTLRDEFGDGQIVADAFCGVGALCVRAAVERGCTVRANDWNPDAVRYCRENARRNGVDGRVGVECGDARDFIAGLGMRRRTANDAAEDGGDDATMLLGSLPHHLMLNYPLASTEFLGALRWWPSHGPMEVSTVVHVYTFARGDNDDGDKDDDRIGDHRRDAAEVAVDMVAEGLLPEDSGGLRQGAARRPRRGGRAVLDGLGCRVRAREVRDVAPGKVVICVSFRATQDLLRRMQGEFEDSQ